MIEIKTNKIQEIIQRVLSCTLWGHIPGESMDIIREENFKSKIEICEELLRQKLKLEKQLKKVNCAYNIALREILQDRNSATNQQGERFRSPDVCVDARYKLIKDFVDHILINIGDCEIDPDTITDIELDIPYVIDYNNPFEYMENTKINNVKDALCDLWFVSSVQPVYDKGKITQFICKCHLQMNTLMDISSNNKTDTQSSEMKKEETSSYLVRQLKDAIVYGKIPDSAVDSDSFINGFLNKDVIECTKEVLKKFIFTTVEEKRYFDGLKKLFSHKSYYCEDEHIELGLDIKTKEVSNSFLDQIIYAIDTGEINENIERFSTVVQYELSEKMGEKERDNYEATVAVFKNLWFVKSVYPHHDQSGIDSLMLVCEIQLRDEVIDRSYKNLTSEVSNIFYEFCNSIQSKAYGGDDKDDSAPLVRTIYRMIKEAAVNLDSYNLINSSNISFISCDDGILKIIIDKLSFLIEPNIQYIDIIKYIEHSKEIFRDPILFVTSQFDDTLDDDMIYFSLEIFVKIKS